jgi:hypothetical protein
VVCREVEGVEFPLVAVKEVDTPSTDGALEAPPEAILIFKKQKFGQSAMRIIYKERNPEPRDCV